ncbi:FAD:protein FMN transferase [Candidatus Protochlamydia phocaeensis]|uniref:FAD:protein FMN transferase n=1 Tax=Candidatus Protochlamydia phocaeensis TaxID=1414722 RepID=UPI0009AC9A39|nr:FAD:protein FMN transferase [Candidatus Protochlamydia phocaeensis]
MKSFKLLFLFFVLLGGCQSPPPKSKADLTVFSQNAMTIDYRILIGGPLTVQQKLQIQQIIHATFAEVDAIYNKWNAHSEVSRLNALKAHETVPLSPQLLQFLERIDALVHLSEGRFDPTVEPLEQLWKSRLERGVEPSLQEINTIKACIGWDKIHFANGQFLKDHDQTQLDLGGIAKGYCVDLLVERLNSAGFANVYVEWGGEIRTSGLHPSQRPWNIYISRLGDTDPAHAIAYLRLTNQAIATSGDYFQYWTITMPTGELRTYCHIFNPKTLSPLIVKPGSIASASLIADDCLIADGLAKVLMLFDSAEEAQAWLEQIQQTIPHLSCWIITRQEPVPDLK